VPLEPEFLLDTGPLAAAFDPRDQYHEWAASVISKIEAPLFSCEPILTEALYLLSKSHNGADLLTSFCETGAIQVKFQLLPHVKAIRDLRQKYHDVPMDLADASLVLLAEQHPQATIITTDRDFLIYRTPSRRRIRLLAPFGDVP
jgi:predicted nucleic acid-binding protein